MKRRHAYDYIMLRNAMLYFTSTTLYYTTQLLLLLLRISNRISSTTDRSFASGAAAEVRESR